MPKTKIGKSMLIGERRLKIIDLLEEKGNVIVSELSSLLSVTEETIRRDLEGLEREGLLKRTYGGAIPTNRISLELSFKAREIEHRQEKKAIGKVAAGLIEDGDALMFDASTTALEVVKQIGARKRLTVISSSLAVVLELIGKSEITVVSTGGVFHSRSLSYVGPLAEKGVRNYHVDKLFLGVKGITIDGITDSYEAEAQLKKTMIESAKEAILVIDSSKFNNIALVNIAPLEVISKIVTDKGISFEDKKLLSERSIEVIIAS
jgi:DeoR family fructose operon transcriptional repressor